MPLRPLTVHTIGGIAAELLAGPTSASVMGTTSRGAFLRLAHVRSDSVVFISGEAYHGPLTLNLQGDTDILRSLKPGAPAHILPGRIQFAPSPIVISLNDAQSWQPSPPPASLLPPGQRRERLAGVARQLSSQRKTGLLSALLPALLGYESPTNVTGNMALPLLTDLRAALRESHPNTIAEALQAFLGLGSGLTPSGDDLIAGLLLALSRWGDQLAPGFPLEALRQVILPAAHRKTALLSASLIECAARGQADERLVLALDGIVAGSASPKACAASLAGWGNTSGVDALVGMALVLAGPITH